MDKLKEDKKGILKFEKYSYCKQFKKINISMKIFIKHV